MPDFFRKCFFLFCLLLAGSSVFAQVTFVGSSANSSDSTTALAVTRPSTNSAHVLIATVSATQPLSTTPAGWTVATSQQYSTTSTWAYIFYRVIVTGDPATVTFNTTTPAAMVASVTAFYGVSTSTPILSNSGRWANSGPIGTNPVNASTAGQASVVLLTRPTNVIPTTPTGQIAISSIARVGLGVASSYELNVPVNSTYSETSTSAGSHIGQLIVLTPDYTPTTLNTCVNSLIGSPGPLASTEWSTTVVNGTFTPKIVAVSGSNRLRLTEAVLNQSTLATVQRRFPSAGNRFVVEFNYYTYGGSGGNGLNVIFSDANVPPVVGAFGGSMGYAQNTGGDGFAGGWLAVGLDEDGRFPQSSDGRLGYPSGWLAPAPADKPAAASANNISVRGSGALRAGYSLLANTGGVTPRLWTSANTATTVQRFRFLLDNSDSVHAYLRVERDLTGTGNSYTTIIPKFDLLGANSAQSAVPANLLVSFTGDTVGSSNNHELGNLNVCADFIKPISGENISNVASLDAGANTPWSAAARQPLYTKIASQSFALDAVPLRSDGTIETNYVRTGYTRYLQMELFPRNPATVCAAYTSPVATNIIQIVNADQGRKTSGAMTIPQAYGDMISRVRECTDGTCSAYTDQVPACSSDRFTVRPAALTVVSSINANPSGTSPTAAPVIKTGAPFTLQASTGIVGYSGIPTAVSTSTEWLNAPVGGIPAGSRGVGNLAGNFTTAAAVASGNNATGALFTYDDVGYFRFQPGGVRDSTWVTTSNDAANNDCIVGSFSNTLSGGNYGCDIANQLVTPYYGRFVPDRLAVTTSALQLRTDVCPTGCGTFQYMDEPMAGVFTLNALNSLGNVTRNYSGAYARYNISISNLVDLGLAGVTPLGTSGPLFSSGSRVNVTGLTGAWSGGAAPGVRVDYTPLSATTSGPRTPDGPYDIAWGIVPMDSDGITLAPTALNLDTSVPVGVDRYRIGTATTRFGKLALTNAAGSNLRPLSVGITAKYWNGTAWVVNTDDSNTPIPQSSIGFGRYSGAMSAAQTNIDAAKSVFTFSSGVGSIVLTPPTGGLRGSFDLGINLSNKNGTNLGKWSGPAMNPGPGDAPTGVANLNYLSNDALGSAYDTDPAARVTFGVYRASDKVIDAREQY